MFALPPFDPGFELLVSSRGMSKGIEQADQPQVIPKAYLQVGDLQVGGQWKNVTSATAQGEASGFLNVSQKFGSFAVTGGAAYKFQTGARPGTDSDSFEFSGSASRKLGRASLRLSAIYSPDDLGNTTRSLYMEGGPSFDLTRTLRLSASIGRRTRELAPDYTAVNFGLTKTVFQTFSLDLRYYQTNRSRLGDIYRRRMIIAGRFTF
jgi:Bacterial protein of unknown function (Gcw_chp)